MAWDGSGNYRPTNGVHSGPDIWSQAEQADRDIRADDMDGWLVDLINTINNTVTRDGQNSPTASLPMNGHKHTDVDDATGDSEYAAWGQTKTRIETDIEEAIAPRVATLADQADIAWDVAANPFGSTTLAGNRRLGNVTNAEEGGIYTFEAIQDATGGRELTYDTGYNFGEEGEPLLSGDAGDVDYLTFVYRGGEMRLVAFAKGY